MLPRAFVKNIAVGGCRSAVNPLWLWGTIIDWCISSCQFASRKAEGMFPCWQLRPCPQMSVLILQATWICHRGTPGGHWPRYCSFLAVHTTHCERSACRLIVDVAFLRPVWLDMMAVAVAGLGRVLVMTDALLQICSCTVYGK
jgi:hypothetical protein